MKPSYWLLRSSMFVRPGFLLVLGYFGTKVNKGEDDLREFSNPIKSEVYIGIMCVFWVFDRR